MPLYRQYESRAEMEARLQRRKATEAQADIDEQRRRVSWFRAHPDRAQALLGEEGAASLGIGVQEYELKLAQQEAKAKANQWEYDFTAKQKQLVAKLNNARQFVESAEHLGPEQKAEALRLIDLQQVGIEPQAIPRDMSKPQYPKGRGPQDSWVQEGSGALVGLDRSGSPRVLVQPDKMPAYLEAETQRQAAAEQEKKQQVYQQAYQKEWLRLATEDISGGLTETSKTRSPPEVDSIMREFDTRFGGGQFSGDDAFRAALQSVQTGEGIQPGMEEAAMQQITAVSGVAAQPGMDAAIPQAGVSGEVIPQVGAAEIDERMRGIDRRAALNAWRAENDKWMPNAKAQGLSVKEADRDLPPQIAFAQALVRTYGVGGRSKVPEDRLASFDEALETLRKYMQLRSAGNR